MSISELLLIIALVVFVVAAIGWSWKKVDLIAIGLALWSLAAIIAEGLSSLSLAKILLILAFIAFVLRSPHPDAASGVRPPHTVGRRGGRGLAGGGDPGGAAPACEPGGDHHRHDRDQDHERDHHVDLRQSLAEPDGAEDPDRQRVLRAGCKSGDDHLIERKREGEHGARHHRGRD